MRKIGLIIAVLSLTMGGCATRVIDYDPENPEIVGEAQNELVPTDPIVLLRDEANIAVVAEKIHPLIYYTNGYDGELERWSITVQNGNNDDRCVGTMWQVMDFRFQTDHPTFAYVNANSSLLLGHMIQTTMDINGVTVALPPSGQLVAFKEFEPINGECLLLDEPEPERDPWEYLNGD